MAEVEGAETGVGMIAPEDAGISSTALAAAASWAETQNSTALLVARDGDLAFERYWQGTGRDTRFNPQSMSKTVLAMLVGIAIDKGVIGSVDDPIGRYVTEWAREPRGAITLRQMLWMSAGLEQGDDGYGYEITPENPIVRHSLGSDFTRLLLSLEPVGAPGETFDYNNQVNQLLGLALERASGRDYEVLLSEWLWQPLGLKDAALPLDREGGLVLTSCCILSRPIDWLRIGGLFATAGRYEGKQVVPEAWLAEMLQPSPGYRGYGYQVWVHDQQVGGERPPRVPLVPWQSEPFAAPQVVIFHGHGGQRVYVMPDKLLVIVRAARQWPDAWDDALLPNVIWRGTADRGETE
ncbi:serine hydrolase [Erythrobacter sp. JK5]|uniref:serine hydrolase domain-containing protein n=1 Tax=Erythrobacter sp. JK5 TaxID=2829500 RepID=UPI001BAC7850|nr:serine hydrolase [Erythrobacter sp. JK5]QUL36977.1 serine hydrolase [Erythrobacter sp. JK5]